MEKRSDTFTLNEDGDNGVIAADADSLAGSGIVFDGELRQLLTTAIQRRASDLHLTAFYPPTFRVDGHIRNIDHTPPMVPDDVLRIFQSMTTKEQRYAFQHELELDFFSVLPGSARLRVNACLQRGSLSMTFRIIPMKVPTIDELGLPKVCERLAMEHHGLVLVTGPTGMGKTTTMATMINHINQNDYRKIVTIEDPIEYVYGPGKSMIIQRNLGNDTKSFAEAVRRATRQNPDVILIGEMRDLETVSAALTAAETGHLVIGTLHTQGAAETINRIVDVFPTGQQQQVRLQLSITISGVLSQILLPRAGGTGRVAAFEVMLGTPAIRNLIRDGKIHQIGGVLEVGGSHGMYTLAQDIKRLIRENVISPEQVQDEIGESIDLDKLEI